jgi:hypothetical protein
VKAYQEQSYYELLELATDASSEEIVQAYERLNEQYSPDSVAVYGLAEPGEAEQLRARLLEAMEILTDEDLRVEYDRSLGLEQGRIPRGGDDEDDHRPVIATSRVMEANPEPNPRLEAALSGTPAPVAKLEKPPAPDPKLKAALAAQVEKEPAPPAPLEAEKKAETVEAPASAPSKKESARAAAKEPEAPGVAPTPPANAPAMEAAAEKVTKETAPAAPVESEKKSATVEAPAASDPDHDDQWTLGPALGAHPGAGKGSSTPSSPGVVVAPTPPAGKMTFDDAQEMVATTAIGVAEAAMAKAAQVVSNRRPPTNPGIKSAPRPYEVPPDAEFNGEVLRRVREGRGLTLGQVSDKTRIATRHLENIEADRYDGLPVMVYLRGILMNLARELGLDGNRVAKSYMALVSARKK